MGDLHLSPHRPRETPSYQMEVYEGRGVLGLENRCSMPATWNDLGAPSLGKACCQSPAYPGRLWGRPPPERRTGALTPKHDPGPKAHPRGLGRRSLTERRCSRGARTAARCPPWPPGGPLWEPAGWGKYKTVGHGHECLIT